MTTNRTENTTDPNALFEKKLIEEYLHQKGYTREGLKQLPPELAEQLMKEATRYASLKMEGISAGARFVEEIHDGGSSRE
ncbi:MAG: hypothetical protein ABI904_11975 [Chloroflexota bacterium]